MRSTIASTSVVVLPVPGPGEHQQRAAGVVDDRPLGGVERRAARTTAAAADERRSS